MISSPHSIRKYKKNRRKSLKQKPEEKTLMISSPHSIRKYKKNRRKSLKQKPEEKTLMVSSPPPIRKYKKNRRKSLQQEPEEKTPKRNTPMAIYSIRAFFLAPNSSSPSLTLCSPSVSRMEATQALAAWCLA